MAISKSNWALQVIKTTLLARVVEPQTAMPKVDGSTPTLDQHSGSQNNWGKSAAFTMTSTND